jgi:hypothetical protein
MADHPNETNRRPSPGADAPGTPAADEPMEQAAAVATAVRPVRERRRNGALRQLVDEMMATIRTAAGRDLWTPEERAQCEAELAQIMARVRAGAISGGETDQA